MMVKTPQRGRMYEGRVPRLGMNIDSDLHHALKKVALENRVTVSTYVIRLVEGAVRGAGGRG